MTAADIIKASLKELSVVGIGDTSEPTTNEYTDYLEVLNRMLKGWATERLLIPARTKESFALIQGKNNYTIGAGGDFNTVRPIKVMDSYTREVSDNDYPVLLVTRDDYDQVAYKKTEGRPYWIYYDPQPTLGVVYLYPTPLAGYTLFIEMLKPIIQFTLTTSTSSMPDEWDDALVYNLAVRLAPKIPVELNPVTIKMARDLKRNLKSYNLYLPTMESDIPSHPNIRGSETRPVIDF